MNAVTNIFRRGAIYYFRRQLRWPDGTRCAIAISLRTAQLARARHLAALLGAFCEKASADRDFCMAGISVSRHQRSLLFHRQLMAERDMLCEWRSAILLSHEDGSAAEYGDPPSLCMEYFLGIMDVVLDTWIHDGLTDLRHRDTLEHYFADRFAPHLDTIACLALQADLQSPEVVLWILNDCAAQALEAAGAPNTDCNRIIILQDLLAAKQAALHEELARLTSPDLPAPFSPAPRVDYWPDDPIGVDPLHPLQHLVRSYATPYPLSDPPQETRLDAERLLVRLAPAPPSREPDPDGWNDMTILQFCAVFLREAPRVRRINSGHDHLETGIEKNTQHQYEVAADWLFQAYPGPLSGLRPIHITDMVDRMDRIDGARFRKSSKQRAVATPADLAEIAGKGLAPATINRHLRNLRTILELYEDRHELPKLRFDRHLRKDKRTDRAKRPATAARTLEAMFALPIWTGSRSERDRKRPGTIVTHDSLYWAPIFIVYMLVRRAEICQATVWSIEFYDLELNGETVTWPYLAIRDTVLGRIKNASSGRCIPLHPELIRLGFLEYREAIIALGHSALFPELVGKTVKPADIWGKRAGHVLHNLLPGLEAGELVHSVRHAGTDLLYNKEDIQKRFLSDLLGHTVNDQTQGTYAKGANLANLRRVIDRLPQYTRYLEPAPLRLRDEVRRRAPTS